MTACAIETTGRGAGSGPVRTALTVAADGSYAVRLVPGGDGCWFPERWTLDGPEPYTVPLPVHQPEEADCGVLPLTDGRVLVARPAGDRYVFALLYPSGAGTGETPLGGIACEEFTLVPQATDDPRVFGLAPGETSTELWLVHDPRTSGPLAPGGPERITRLPGRCSGGVRLDRTGDLLAVDQELDGRTKTVVVHLRRGGLTTPLLQLTEDSNDRLLMADPDSGLLIVRSDAPGQDRLGWGVLGSSRPVRFPQCLEMPDATVRPFALQPGQALLPEQCAVALRVEGSGGSWVAVWRPCDRRLRQFPAPDGWLTGTGMWTRTGELRLPYSTPGEPCGVARTTTPALPVPSRPQLEPVPRPGADARPAFRAAFDAGAAPAGDAPVGDAPDAAGGAAPDAAGPETGTGPGPRPGSGASVASGASGASGASTAVPPSAAADAETEAQAAGDDGAPDASDTSEPRPSSDSITPDALPSGSIPKPTTPPDDDPTGVSSTGPVPLQKVPFPVGRAS